MTPKEAADRLIAARKTDVSLVWREDLPPDRAAAYAVQDASLSHIGPIGGWKVGAAGPEAEPHCAPLPASGVLPSGTALEGAPWHRRCVEVEAALRVGRDLDPDESFETLATLVDAFDAVLPVIEVVETRLAGWPDCDPMAKLADLQSHGALILGKPSSFPPAMLDLRTLDAYLTFDGRDIAKTRGGNGAVDVWRMVAWLVSHCAQRGHPLRAGQIVTTGTCTGMLFAPAGTHVVADLAGIGGVELRF